MWEDVAGREGLGRAYGREGEGEWTGNERRIAEQEGEANRWSRPSVRGLFQLQSLTHMCLGILGVERPTIAPDSNQV